MQKWSVVSPATRTPFDNSNSIQIHPNILQAVKTDDCIETKTSWKLYLHNHFSRSKKKPRYTLQCRLHVSDSLPPCSEDIHVSLYSYVSSPMRVCRPQKAPGGSWFSVFHGAVGYKHVKQWNSLSQGSLLWRWMWTRAAGDGGGWVRGPGDQETTNSRNCASRESKHPLLEWEADVSLEFSWLQTFFIFFIAELRDRKSTRLNSSHL